MSFEGWDLEDVFDKDLLAGADDQSRPVQLKHRYCRIIKALKGA